MTTRWLAAAALVAALAGCAGEAEREPATVPVAPGVSSPAVVSPAPAGSASPGAADGGAEAADGEADATRSGSGDADRAGTSGASDDGEGDAANRDDAAAPGEAAAPGGAADDVLESAEGSGARGRTRAEIEAAQAGGVNAFVAAVRREFPALLLDRRDEEIAMIAERACGSLAAGRSGAEVATQAGADAPGVDAATARRLVELAVKTVCPDLDRRLGS